MFFLFFPIFIFIFIFTTVIISIAGWTEYGWAFDDQERIWDTCLTFALF